MLGFLVLCNLGFPIFLISRSPFLDYPAKSNMKFQLDRLQEYGLKHHSSLITGNGCVRTWGLWEFWSEIASHSQMLLRFSQLIPSGHFIITFLCYFSPFHEYKPRKPKADQVVQFFLFTAPTATVSAFVTSHFLYLSIYPPLFCSLFKAKSNSHFLLEVFIALNIVVWFLFSLNSSFSASWSTLPYSHYSMFQGFCVVCIFSTWQFCKPVNEIIRSSCADLSNISNILFCI